MSVSWTADMIAADEEFDGAPVLRNEFTLDEGHGDITQATLHATARGIFTASVNGDPVGDDVLSPGWSSYEWRLRYRSYDVTDLVQAAADGRVVLGLELGNGWYRGAWGGRVNARSTAPNWARWRNWRWCSPTGTGRPSPPTSRGGPVRPR